jgi:predicted phosphate transport protein (TIGR00153 family)
MRLFPKEIDFFEIFDRMAGNVHNASGQLVELLKDFDRIDERVQEIYSIEQQGDMLTHDIIKRLNKTFLTPIDREDIHALADRMDDILDLIWAVADRIKIFKINKSNEEALSMARDLHRTVDVINMAFKELSSKNYSHVQEHCIEINRLENRVDRNYKAALASLFDGDHDPVTIIKWKDIYERLEDACNRCEDVANILEAVLLKHG